MLECVENATFNNSLLRETFFILFFANLCLWRLLQLFLITSLHLDFLHDLILYLFKGKNLTCDLLQPFLLKKSISVETTTTVNMVFVLKVIFLET
jgi:hypothetical protein